jgi:hypothetical protein
MRSSGKTHSLFTAAALAAASAGLPSLGTKQLNSRAYRPNKPKRNTELQREISDWNEAVEAKRKAKKAQP